MAKSKPMTAAEVMALRAKDPVYQEMRGKQDLEIAERERALEKEAESFAQECAAVGYKLKTPWDLVQTAERYPALIPVLLKHLANRAYSAKFREGVGRALATPDSSTIFEELLELFKSEGTAHREVRWSIGCALSVAAQEAENLNIIEQLVQDKSFGEDRAALLGAVKRMPKEQRSKIVAFAKEDSALKGHLSVHKLR